MVRVAVVVLSALLFTSCCNTEVKTKPEKKSEPVFSETRRPYNSLSPTITHIEKLSLNERKQKAEKLMAELKDSGTPFIEADSLESGYKYVTFLYENSNLDLDISFEVFGMYNQVSLGDKQLHRMSGTNFYYRTYKFPDDICFSYRFVETNRKTGKERTVTDPHNKAHIPHGEVKSFSYSVLDFRSDEYDWNIKRYETDSRIDTLKIYDKTINRDRRIYVYLPPGYSPDSSAYPVIYLFDAAIYRNRVEVPNILDNMITNGRIQPMVAVMMSSYRKTRSKTLPLNFEFKDVVVNEIVPMIRAKYNVSKIPDENIIGGMSYGGLAAGFMVFYHPEMFGKILSQSGSFWRDTTLSNKAGEWVNTGWLTEQYITAETKPLKLFLDWGKQEYYCHESGKRFVRTLHKKGYAYKFIEFNGWHDWSNSRKTFPEGLVYLLDRN